MQPFKRVESTPFIRECGVRGEEGERKMWPFKRVESTPFICECGVEGYGKGLREGWKCVTVSTMPNH